MFTFLCVFLQILYYKPVRVTLITQDDLTFTWFVCSGVVCLFYYKNSVIDIDLLHATYLLTYLLLLFVLIDYLLDWYSILPLAYVFMHLCVCFAICVDIYVEW